jgi:hypothetical protein
VEQGNLAGIKGVPGEIWARMGRVATDLEDAMVDGMNNSGTGKGGKDREEQDDRRAKKARLHLFGNGLGWGRVCWGGYVRVEFARWERQGCR